MSKYINLHLHDFYSSLDGYSSPEEYIARAKEIGVSAVAQTNHGTLTGLRHHQRVCADAGIKPILGIEAYLSPTDRWDRRSKANREEADSIYNHIILLGKNDIGINSIQKGNRIAWNDGFYSKARWDLELLTENSKDVIALSGCFNGVMSKAFDRGDDAAAYEWAHKLLDVFGEDFYVEIQTHNPIEMNNKLLKLADELKIKPVVTDDCHHANPEDKIMQEVFLILSTHPKQDRSANIEQAQKLDLMERFDYLYPNRKMTFKDFDLYLERYEEKREKMRKLGWDREDIYENTLEIADKIGDYTYYEDIPTLPDVVENVNETLVAHVYQALKDKNLEDKAHVDRAEYELKVITDKNFSNYFLILEDLLAWCRQQNIRIGKGRGSAAGSLVCYALGITGIDPLVYGLLFERFMDPERGDWPDADIDIQDSRREEVRGYLIDKYKHVANITNINTYKGKGALKDAARAIGVPYGEVNKTMKILEGIEEITGHDVIAEFKAAPKARAFNKKYPDVVNIAEKLYGRINGYGMHACGIIISDVPISDYAPIETRKKTGSDERVEVVAFDKDECERLGFIKIDLLGLKTLSVIDDAVKLIKENSGILVDIDAVSLDNPKVFETISSGKTLGVFQAEKAASTKLILKMGVENFNDLVVSNALVRPGAWNAIGEDYIAFKKGTRRAKTIHADVEDYMAETFYQPVFQEQMMRLSVDIAGFTVGESNKLRKGIGKKKRDIIDEFKPKFIEGAKNKISEALAEKLWKSFEESGAYAFNLSHAVCYSIISFQTAWLKLHYPIEFMCALLQNESNTDTVTDYLLECKNMGIKVKLPHINRSDLAFSIDKKDLRMGLVGVKYISDKIANRIISERPYENYNQFQEYVLRKGSGLNSRVLMALNSFGGAAFEDNPAPDDYKDKLYEFLSIPAFDTKLITKRMKETMRTLDEYTDDETFLCMVMVKSVKRGEGWARVDMLDSTASAGVFTSPNTDIAKGQMYIFLIGNNRIQKYISLAGDVDAAEDIVLDFIRRPILEEIPEGQYKILAAEARKTKAGKNMAYVTVANAQKELQTLLVFDSAFDKVRLFCKLGAVRALSIAKTKDGTKFINDVS